MVPDIVDLCCGDGGTTYELLKEIDATGIKVKEMVGYDISPEQIERAGKYAQQDKRLRFAVQDVEKLHEKNKYDLAISLFGLHWMENIKDTANGIYRLLKPNGKVLFLRH